ncbi:haptoglobin isoform X2 [Chanos chanos]|uniref:Haptoglobin isoform X2 n=1 Tax=Chanos chanos TaxID=29144 RepID=A0A6J2UTA8_CHACN|nr:haptoglobin-like isoform X2 [Chanos chanos]
MTWLSLAVFLLGSLVCLPDESLAMAVNKEHVSGNTHSSLRSRRMVGGSLGTVPWQAMVYLSEGALDGGFAGGALIADRWVLTAGRNLFVRKSREHTKGKEPIIPKVYLGMSNRKKAKDAEVAVEKVFLHPEFQNVSEWDNDLALIKLKEPVSYSDSIMPIPLPEGGEEPALKEGEKGVIAGWGWGALLTPAEILKFLALPIASQSECRAEYQDRGEVSRPNVDDKMFCTGPTKFQENVCFGDAGGALVLKDPRDSSVYAAGILSFDKSCTSEKHAVYTKISAYLPWIHSVMRGDTEKFSALRTSIVTEMLAKGA